MRRLTNQMSVVTALAGEVRGLKPRCPLHLHLSLHRPLQVPPVSVQCCSCCVPFDLVCQLRQLFVTWQQGQHMWW